MSIFINKDARFEVKVFYTEIGNSLIIHPEGSPNCEVQTFWFRKANWEDCCEIMSNSFVPYEGSLILNPYVFLDVKLRKLMVDWDLKDGEGKPVPFSVEAISSIEPNVAEYVSKKIDQIIFPSKPAEDKPEVKEEVKAPEPVPVQPPVEETKTTEVQPEVPPAPKKRGRPAKAKG